MFDAADLLKSPELNEKIIQDNVWNPATVQRVGRDLAENKGSNNPWGLVVGLLGDYLQKAGNTEVPGEERIRSQMDLANELKRPLHEIVSSPDKSAIPTFIDKYGENYRVFWQLLWRMSTKSPLLQDLKMVKNGALSEVATQMMFKKLGPNDITLKPVPLETDWGCGFDFIAMNGKYGKPIAKLDAKSSMDTVVQLIPQNMRLPAARWSDETKGIEALCAGGFGIKDAHDYAEIPLYNIHVPSAQSRPDLYRHTELPFLSDVGIALLDEENVDQLLARLVQ